MKTVRADDGTRYLLVKRSGDASLVRDPSTGNECYVRNDRLETVDGANPLETAASGVDPTIRTFLRTVHDDETLGLLVDLADRGPTSVRTLLERYDSCESDLHGRLTQLTLAELLEETTVDGERAYRLTDECARVLEVLRSAADAD